MNTGGLEGFLTGSFITIISAFVIAMILKHWKEGAWLKIGSVIVIALIILDFANNQGNTTLGLVKWGLSLFGINFK